MFRKYTLDPSHAIQWVEVPIEWDVKFDKQPVQILRRELKVLRNKEIPFIKVLSENYKEEEAIWEFESEMLEKYPYLFEFQPDDIP